MCKHTTIIVYLFRNSSSTRAVPYQVHSKQSAAAVVKSCKALLYQVLMHTHHLGEPELLSYHLDFSFICSEKESLGITGTCCALKSDKANSVLFPTRVNCSKSISHLDLPAPFMTTFRCQHPSAYQVSAFKFLLKDVNR